MFRVGDTIRIKASIKGQQNIGSPFRVGAEHTISSVNTTDGNVYKVYVNTAFGTVWFYPSEIEYVRRSNLYRVGGNI